MSMVYYHIHRVTGWKGAAGKGMEHSCRKIMGFHVAVASVSHTYMDLYGSGCKDGAFIFL